MSNDTTFRHLWLQFQSEELLTNIDGLFYATPPFVRENLHTINLKQGEKLLEQGNQANFVYIILDGEFLINKLAINGRQLGVTLCYQGEFLGEIEVLTREKNQYDAIALRDSKVICLEANYFLRWLEQDLSLSLLLNRQLAKRMLISGQQRLMSIADSVENNLLYILSNIKDQKVELSREILANILGTSVRHINKVIMKLTEKGVISKYATTLKLNNQQR